MSRTYYFDRKNQFKRRKKRSLLRVAALLLIFYVVVNALGMKKDTLDIVEIDITNLLVTK